MITRYRAAMNGVQLDSLDDRIIITDIIEDAPSESVTTNERPSGGSYLTAVSTQSITVRIAVELHSQSVSTRQGLFTTVCRWGMGGGYLNISGKPYERIHIDKLTLPTLDSLKWTEALEFQLTAYSCPWWEDIDAQTITGNTARYSDVWFYNYGHMPMTVDVTATVATGTMTGIILASGYLQDGTSVKEHTMTFTGLTVAAGESFTLSHDSDGILHIEAAGISVLDKRTASSADDLIIPVDSLQRFVTCDAGDGVTATLSVSYRRRYY